MRLARVMLRPLNGLLSLVRLWPALLGALALLSAAPASAQADSRWGVLAQLAEHDFKVGDDLVTVRWDVPDKRLVVTTWYAWAHISSTFQLDESTGIISGVRQGGDRYPALKAQPNGDLVQADNGHRFGWVEPDGIIRWWGSGYKPLPAGGLSARLDKIIRENKVRAADPSRLEQTELASAASQRPQTAAPITSPTVQALAQAPQNINLAAIPSGPRYALVIGNAQYGASLGKLPNPVNDAQSVAAALKAVGFNVDLVTDADQKGMKRAISRFGERLAGAGKGATGLFYYAGHGIQSRGTNYLIPVSAPIEREADLDLEAVAADTVLAQMEDAGSATSIVILDACRNMPLARSFRSASRGLARMDAPNGSFIAYSTAPGATAADGDGRNSPFAAALVKQLGQKGTSIEAVFRGVRRQVVDATGGQQTPWDSSSLLDPFYFVP